MSHLGRLCHANLTIVGFFILYNCPIRTPSGAGFFIRRSKRPFKRSEMPLKIAFIQLEGGRREGGGGANLELLAARGFGNNKNELNMPFDNL
jgi:hypothetical protein